MAAEANILVGALQHGAAEVDGQIVWYKLREVDARSPARRQADAEARRLGGEIAVVLPRHGQSVLSPGDL